MGTHPIFESDFDCLTEYTARANMTWGKDETANMARGDNDDGWGSPEEDHTPQQQRCQFKGQQANQNRNNNQPVRDKKQSNPELYFEMEDFDGGNQGGRGGGGGGAALPRPSSPPPPSWTCPKLPFPTTSTTPTSSAPPPPRRPRRASSRRRTRSTPLPSSARPTKRPSMPVS